MYSLNFSASSERDIIDGHKWYEAQQPGLGSKFTQKLVEALSKIEGSPGLYSYAHGRSRQAKVPISLS